MNKETKLSINWHTIRLTTCLVLIYQNFGLKLSITVKPYSHTVVIFFPSSNSSNLGAKAKLQMAAAVEARLPRFSATQIDGTCCLRSKQDSAPGAQIVLSVDSCDVPHNVMCQKFCLVPTPILSNFGISLAMAEY